MRPRPGLALLVLLPALAGCTVEPPEVQGTPPTAQAPLQSGPGSPLPPGEAGFELDPNLTAEAILLPGPLWVRGDHWRWSVNTGQGSGNQQFVVYGETATDYLIATTDANDAAQTAFYARSLPGRVNKATLSGYDQGILTRYLDFPLQTNKTWTLHVRGTDYLVKANFTRSLEANRGPGFLVEGASATGQGIALTYAPSAKWMTRFQLLDPAGGSIFQRTLNAHGTNYTGPYYTAEVEDLHVEARNGTAFSGPPVAQFSQGRPYTKLHLLLAASGTGTADLRIVDSAGQLRYNYTLPPPGSPQQVEADLPSLVGPWYITWNLAGPVEVFLRIAGIDVREGKL